MIYTLSDGSSREVESVSGGNWWCQYEEGSNRFRYIVPTGMVMYFVPLSNGNYLILDVR